MTASYVLPAVCSTPSSGRQPPVRVFPSSLKAPVYKEYGNMMDPEGIVALLRAFARWAVTQERVLAVGLAGSYARGNARPDSDVDLVVLVTDPTTFRRETAWVREVGWDADVASWADEDYGPLWSRRIELASGLEIEVGFTASSWADTDPVDAGTYRVVRDGFRIILDPMGILTRLVVAVLPG